MSAVEPEPDVAATLFRDRIALARLYTSHLATRGEELGLIGPLEPARLWTRHIINCVIVAPLLQPGTVGDVGSGAGLPGMVLAIARPDVRFVLIEPMERRVDWLRGEAVELGLGNVTVVRSRAEDARLDHPLDQVTARAVTSLSRLIPVTAGLIAAGGQMIFMKGARVEEEITAAQKVIHRFRLIDVETLVLGQGMTTEVTRVFRATVDRPRPSRAGVTSSEDKVSRETSG